MKVSDIRPILEQGSIVYGSAGALEVARALAELAEFLKVADASDVNEFVARIQNLRRARGSRSTT
jgi:hypothetical protein